MNNLEICKRCGSEIEFRRNGSSQGMFCKKCDWSLVTTYIPEIRKDTTIYSVYIVEADLKNINQVKAISKVSGMNYLDTKVFLQQGQKMVCKGEATEILRVKDILDSVDVKYSIIPEFNY